MAQNSRAAAKKTRRKFSEIAAFATQFVARSSWGIPSRTAGWLLSSPARRDRWLLGCRGAVAGAKAEAGGAWAGFYGKKGAISPGFPIKHALQTKSNHA